MKGDMEKRLGSAIDPNLPIFEWIVRHSADLLNKFSVGVDGRTPWQRLRGVPYKGEMVSIGARIMHRLSGRMQGGLMVDRWIKGHWLGKNTPSDEHLVLTDVGTVVRTRSVKAMDTKMVFDLLVKTPPCIWGGLRPSPRIVWTKASAPTPSP